MNPGSTWWLYSGCATHGDICGCPTLPRQDRRLPSHNTHPKDSPLSAKANRAGFDRCSQASRCPLFEEAKPLGVNDFFRIQMVGASRGEGVATHFWVFSGSGVEVMGHNRPTTPQASVLVSIGQAILGLPYS